MMIRSIKVSFLCSIAFLLCHCQTATKEKKEEKKSVAGTDTLTRPKDLLQFPEPGTTIVYVEGKDTSSYDNAELNRLLRENPALSEKYPSPPGESTVNSKEFTSEVGQDSYYILYGYLLKQKNGEEKYRAKRRNLIQIYRTINSIFQQLTGGGTYYGHLYSRIIGIAEFDIYNQEDNDHYERSYDISKQKRLYIEALRQFVKDELELENSRLPEEKKKLETQVISEIDSLDKLITDFSLLKSARDFQYTYY